jgi:asparagine synthase (glutamine-hydrolysing)
MPGIVGIFSSDQPSAESERSIAGMRESLRHSATQTSSTYRYQKLILGRVDLGVFQGNLQPKETADVIAFIWGELVNPQEERKRLLNGRCRRGKINDVDFLIGLHSRSKQDLGRYLRGSFNAFIVDQRRKTIEIVNDRFGFRPLYYHRTGDELVFASEVKAILKHGKFKKVVNAAGLADFFHFGFVTGDKTFFEGIEMLPSGVTAEFRNGDLKVKKYWDPAFTDTERPNQSSESEHVYQLATAIQDAVKVNTDGGFRFGLPLSGGLDSRVIAACIPRDRYPIPIYTWGMPGSREVQIAREVADTLGLEHHNLHRTPEEFVENFEMSVIMTDGMIPANLPLVNFLYQRSFAPCVDICLDGMQSIAVVHPIHFRAMTRENAFEHLAGGPSPGILKTVLHDCYYDSFNKLAAASRAELMGTIQNLRHPINACQYLDITQKQRRLDNFGVLVKRNFVEVRSPLFDYPVVDVVQSIPPRLRSQRYAYYKAFTCISPQLARVRNVATMLPVAAPHYLQLTGRVAKGLKGRLYQALAKSTGMAFDRHKLSDWGIDYGSWYNESNAVKGFVSRVLSPESLNNSEHLNAKGVAQIVAAQSNGGINHSGTLNRLMTYAMWSKNFL